ncbi:hypothetical protein QJS10_CPA08g00238 [Acorus calamus]|uniref:acylaminoacyl-peptidase n=1 Tax=Acorus calamus TaxID=4465 RepID=A0AAV9EC34_ACOCL|nr:hypothetical protein QJS10_CPA08g00238 [Acorus calamus]
MICACRGATADPYGHFLRRRFSLPNPSLRRPNSPLHFPSHPFTNTWKCMTRAMQMDEVHSAKEIPLGLDATMEDEYASQAKLLKEFTNVPTINKGWIFNSDSGKQAMFSVGQPDLLANKKRTLILSSHISEENNCSVKFHWSPFPIEMVGVSTVVPSPSGSKLLVVRKKDNGSPMQLEIWDHSLLEKEIHIPLSVHGALYTDGWFEGISWNHEETHIAYVAEEPCPLKPTFDGFGYKKGVSSDKGCGSWKGQGEWEEHWGETYSDKRQPALFVVDINSGEVRAVEGITKSLSVGQVVWAPSSSKALHKYLVFVGWSSDNDFLQTKRKLGIKYCYNRPCALYAVRSPFSDTSVGIGEDSAKAVNLTPSLSSAFFPRFSPDGKVLVFLSAKTAVDTGAHSATNSLHKMEWPSDGNPSSSIDIVDVVPVVLSADDGCLPGLYCSGFLNHPWLSDGYTLILSTVWGSVQAIVSINVSSCKISRISPLETSYSWVVLAVDGDNILAVCSSLIDPPQFKYGSSLEFKERSISSIAWDWFGVVSPLSRYSEKIKSLLSTLQLNIMKIPVPGASEEMSGGAKKPFEAIFVSHSSSQSKDSSKGSEKNGCNPLIVVLHGGPHSVTVSSYSKSLAFLSSLGYNLLIVNYRGSLGFGEEALQSLPGKIGFQDVQDVLAAMDHVIQLGIVDPSRVAVLGGSHGGFLSTHLIGQAPERFAGAAVRNPVCNLSLMVGTTDIPDWCYVETYGKEWKNFFTEAPSAEHLSLLYEKSPISHLSKVKTPTLFLLGAQDLRVPVSNGLQYARALKEKGGEVKVIVFPNDVHAIEKPQSDFESFLNIGVWFKKYCK